MTAQRICFGRGRAIECVPDIQALGKSILLVHGANAGRSHWLRCALEDMGCAVSGFSVAHEPDIATIETGIQDARAFGADSVCAIGGGAVIDAGKAIAALVPSSRNMLDHLEVVGKGLPLDRAPLPFAALPTTAGTGAEVTRNAVISVPEHQRKVSLRDPQMLPDLAVVDPSLTDHCPRQITLASGLDAITQVIEPYVCTKANVMTDALCRDAIMRGLCALRSLMEAEDQAARDELAWVSLCGGLALANAGLGAVHGLAGPLGGLTNAAHGALCGTLLPEVMKANYRYSRDDTVKQKFDEIASWIAVAFGQNGNTDLEDAANCLADWSGKCGLPRLGQLGVTHADRTMAAEAASRSSSMKANPVALSREQLEAVMAAVAWERQAKDVRNDKQTFGLDRHKLENEQDVG